MATVNDIYAFLNDLAPVRYQMDFDNAGFLVGDGSAAVEHVLLALDITDEVIAEAAELHAQLIVSHHPLIFTPLRRATADDLTGAKCLRSRGTALQPSVCIRIWILLTAASMTRSWRRWALRSRAVSSHPAQTLTAAR